MNAWWLLVFVVLIILCLLLGVVVGRWLRRGPAARAEGGGKGGAEKVKRRELIERAIRAPAGRELLQLEPSSAPAPKGYLYEAEANVEGRKLVAAGPLGPPHRGLYLMCWDARYGGERNTFLHPHRLRRIAGLTASRVYAWAVCYAAEGRYAIRRATHLSDEAMERLTEAILAGLGGDPPHKMGIAAFAKILTAHGFEVAYAPLGDGEVRFTPAWLQPAKALQRQRAALLAMTQADFDALDWGEVDRQIRPLLASNRERGGDLAIVGDPAAGKRRLAVLKLREGLTGHVAHMPSRSPISFHTHPLGRTGMVEQPSGSAGDLSYILYNSCYEGLMWHVIVAPEGEYIIAATDSLLELYDENPKAAIMIIAREYDETYCSSAPPVCLEEFLGLIRRIGFLVYFRPDAKWAENAAGLPPYYGPNEADPEQFAADFKTFSAIPPKEALGFDWDALLADQEAHLVSASTWLPVEVQEGRIVPKAGGHAFEPSDPGHAWEWSRSPLVALYHSPTFDAPPSFTKTELNEYLRLHARGQLAMLLLTTPTALLAVTAGEKAREFAPSAPDVPGPADLAKQGFEVAEKKR